MSVEYIPFDPTLIGKEEIIIWCPEKADYANLAEVLEDYGVRWVDGDTPTGWFGYAEHSNARHIDKKRDMWRGSNWFYESERRYQCCVFMKWPSEQEVTPDVGDLI